jgi:hypothetical protein
VLLCCSKTFYNRSTATPQHRGTFFIEVMDDRQIENFSL